MIENDVVFGQKVFLPISLLMMMSSTENQKLWIIVWQSIQTQNLCSLPLLILKLVRECKFAPCPHQR